MTKRFFDSYATALREPALRRIALAYVAFNVAEWATWIAILVYAYERGGAAASGFVAVAQLIPAALFAPAGAALADRISRARMLTLAYLAQTLAMLAVSLALDVSASNAVVYTLAAIAATSITLTRPAQNGLLPSLNIGPEALTSANALLSAIENASIVGGPAVAGVVLAGFGAGAVFTLMALLLAVGAFVVAPVREAPLIRRATLPRATRAETQMAAIGRAPGAVVLIAVLAVQQLQVGALDVLFVALGLGALNIGETGVGLLTSAVGVGGVVGAVAAGVIVARRSLPLAVAVGSLVWGVGLALVATTGVVAAVFALVIVAGAGRGLMDVAGRTLLQRVAPLEALSLAFGALESLTMGALAIGAAAAPLLVERYGAPGGIAAIGVVLPVIVALTSYWLMRARERIPEIRPIQLLRAVPLFAPLPEPTLQRLSAALMVVDAPEGTTVVREGEPGDRFYLIEDGHVDVSVGGKNVGRLGPGQSFGEIALLRDVPRTATVRATDAALLYALDRERFLEAVQTRPSSAHALDAVAREA